MSEGSLWIAERTYSGSKLTPHFYLERNRELVLIANEPLDKVIAIKAYEKPIYPLIWTWPSEIKFEVWYKCTNQIVVSDGSDLLINGSLKISRHEIEAVHFIIENDGAVISVKMQTNENQIHDVHVHRNNVVPSNLSVDAAWAELFARDLAAWAGVIVKECRDEKLLKEYLPAHSILKEDHYMTKYCNDLTQTAASSFRVVTDTSRKLDHFDTADFKIAKQYADDVVSEDFSHIAFVYNDEQKPVYRGKHY